MNFLYIGASYHLKFTAAIKALNLQGHRVIVKNSPTDYLAEINSTITLAATKHATPIHGIILSDVRLLKKYVVKSNPAHFKGDEASNLQNYTGSMFWHDCKSGNGTPYRLPVVVVPSPEPLLYSKQVQFVYERMIRKLYDPEFAVAPRLEYSVIQKVEQFDQAYKMFRAPNCKVIAIDVETVPAHIPNSLGTQLELPYRGKQVSTEGMWFLGYGRTPSGTKSKNLEFQMPIITCSGYTGIFEKPDGSLYSYTVVIPFNSMKSLGWIRAFNKLPAPKVMHNGRYDSMYFLRMNAPVHNYVYDTYMLMHSYYVELPRTLDFTQAFALRNSMYWKDESAYDLYLYNAKDCHATAWSLVSILNEYPDWAWTNYLSVFKQVFPCITCGLEGFKEDPEESTKLWKQYKQEIAESQGWWDKVVTPNFNISSPTQVKKLFVSVLKTGIKDTSAPSLNKIKYKHPLWRKLITKLQDGREAKKADSTYMNIILFSGRILYELDPSGTDTGRYASKGSSFWCGTQIQNQPNYTKSKFIFDEGWEGNAVDNSQSESRTTAYITGDENLIDAVENAKDFHIRNASMFFGIPEEQLFAWKASDAPEDNAMFHKFRNKIGKRLNHGANYNMMAMMLITQMTPEVIIEAKHALKLPGRYTFKQVADYLLKCFDTTYPIVRSKEEGGYHYNLIHEVGETSRLVTPDNWTRFTWKQPDKAKLDLNALVAHLPQSWSVRSINRAFFDSWHRLQITENKIRMKAQIHDELMWQNRPADSEYCKQVVQELMARPNHYIDKQGKEQTMVIPNEATPSGTRWSQLNH